MSRVRILSMSSGTLGFLFVASPVHQMILQISCRRFLPRLLQFIIYNDYKFRRHVILAVEKASVNNCQTDPHIQTLTFLFTLISNITRIHFSCSRQLETRDAACLSFFCFIHSVRGAAGHQTVITDGGTF
jgi:hypothetical protein